MKKEIMNFKDAINILKNLTVNDKNESIDIGINQYDGIYEHGELHIDFGLGNSFEEAVISAAKEVIRKYPEYSKYLRMPNDKILENFEKFNLR